MRDFLAPLLLLALVLSPLARGSGSSSGSVEAGTAFSFSLEELSAEASLILEGQVLTTAGVSRNGRIETDVLLSVDRTHAGLEHAYRWITLPGGVLPSGNGMLLAGVPQLRVGERVVLFLSDPNDVGVRMPTGLSQGKWTVHHTADGSRWMSQSAPTGITLLGGAEDNRAIAYSDFLARVEAGRLHVRR